MNMNAFIFLVVVFLSFDAMRMASFSHKTYIGLLVLLVCVYSKRPRLEAAACCAAKISSAASRLDRAAKAAASESPARCDGGGGALVRGLFCRLKAAWLRESSKCMRDRPGLP